MSAWRSFWEGPSPFPPETWDWQSDLFLELSAKVFPIGPNDRLLDLGCGPGTLPAALCRRASASGRHGPLVADYLGLDISAAAVASARDRLRNVAGDRGGREGLFRFAVLGADALDLSTVPSRRFSRLLALSVAQYYRDTSELRRLLDAFGRLAAPGAVALIADLPLRHRGGTVAEMLRTLRQAALQGGLSRHLAFLWRCAFSEYRAVRRVNGLLAWDREELEALMFDFSRRHGVAAEVLDMPLTLSLGRAHLRLRFPE